MKYRIMILAIASLAGSLAFADNPTDAPLMSNDGISAVQPDNRPSCKQNRAGKKSEAKADNANAKHNRKMKQANPTV